MQGATPYALRSLNCNSSWVACHHPHSMPHHRALWHLTCKICPKSGGIDALFPRLWMSTQTETGLIPEDLWWGWAPEAWLPWHSVLLAHRTLVPASKLQPLPKSVFLNYFLETELRFKGGRCTFACVHQVRKCSSWVMRISRWEAQLQRGC